MTTKHYDEIVVGSGISGMTLALLLAKNGKRVLLLEKAPIIGGSMCRFYRDGIPFDTGFHFTGGFTENGILSNMLKVLGIFDDIEPLYIEKEQDNQIVFEDSGEVFQFPSGYDEVIVCLKKYFPNEVSAIDTYFEKVKKVCDVTVTMDLRTITMSAEALPEDYISLLDELDLLIKDKRLKAILAHYAMCYGTKPSEFSFANHSRVCFNLYQSVARVKGGGDAFINAFKKRFVEYDVDVRTGCHITECLNVKQRNVERFRLNTGDEVIADHCSFTIHPQGIMKTLGDIKSLKSFRERIHSFEPSVGFFSLFATVESDECFDDDFSPAIIQLFPYPDVEEMFKDKDAIQRALVIMKMRETVRGKVHNVINAFELSFVEDVEKWKDSSVGERPADYYEYKQLRSKEILKRIFEAFPEYQDKLTVLDTSSILTFRDYLNSPFGCAYGIKQRIGQYNLFGRLPIKNIYASGQSAVLPGLIGSMMSSFIIGRGLIGKDLYCDFINKSLED